MAEACLIIKAERQFPCANGRPLQKEKAQPKEKEKVVKPNYKRIAGAPAPRRQKRETDRNGFVFHFSRYAHFHQKRAIIIRCSKILFCRSADVGIPKMVCAIAVFKILIKRDFLLQTFNAYTQCVFITRKRMVLIIRK